MLRVDAFRKLGAGGEIDLTPFDAAVAVGVVPDVVEPGDEWKRVDPADLSVAELVDEPGVRSA